MFVFIWRHSRKQQIAALLLTVISFPFLYVSLDLPKTIINEAIGTQIDPATAFPRPYLAFDLSSYGIPVSFDGFMVSQIGYLFILCGFFLALVFINGGFKMKINTFVGVMAERLLRRLRYLLLDRTLRFPLPEFQRTSQGEVVSMVTQEVEPLGGFFGDAFVLVAFQGGIFLTIMTFMFVQDPLLGLAAFAMIPVQAYIIPKLQKKVNALGKERVRHVRSMAGRISEVVSGIQDVHAQDASTYVMSDIGGRLGRIFWIRFEIYQRKFFMKFLNNFLGQLTPFFFFSVGGYLVITGGLTVGALVAALAAYKDLAAPWKELLNYYQRMADAKIKYDAVISQFDPPGMLPDELQLAPPAERPTLDGAIQASNLSYADEDGARIIEGASFTLEPGSKTAFLSNNGTAKETLTRLLGRLLSPTGGKISIGDHDLARLHESVIGDQIGVIGSEAAFFNATIAANLFLGLQHVPPSEGDPDEARKRDIEEAIETGNLPHLFEEDWTDYQAAGVSNREELLDRTIDLVNRFDLREDLYELGLRQVIDPETHPEIVEKVLQARTRMREVLDRRGLSDLVRNYDFDEFNTHASVAENILFGEPRDEAFHPDNLGSNPVVLEVLEEFGLRDDFLQIGLRCAEIMLDLFQDLPPGHPFFEQYSFVDEDLLPELKVIVRNAQQNGLESISGEDTDALMSLPFKLIQQRHRLGLIDEGIQKRLVAVRKRLHEKDPESFAQVVQPFDADGYNPGLSILDNILFGKIMYGQADAASRVLEALEGIVEELGMDQQILMTSFEFNVGIGGGRLSSAQRQKISLIRNVLKRPHILVVNEALGALDKATQARLVAELLAQLPDSTLVWVDSAPAPGIDFDHSFEIRSGRIVHVEGAAAEAAAPAEETADEAAKAEEAALGAETTLLRELPLFANLDPAKLRFLAFTSDRLNYRPGELLVKQGDQGDAAYVVLSGEAEVVLEGANGEETSLFVMGRGQVLGELAMLCDTPRSATVRAKSAVTALKLNREVFVELARQDPYFSFEMTRDLGQRLLKTTAELSARS